MKLSSLTALGFETNAFLDATPGLNLTFAEIHDAADRGHLVQFLAGRYADNADFSRLLKDPKELAAVNQALKDAASSVYGCERRKFGVSRSALCLVIAIVLEAIQQRFIAPSPIPEPEPALT